MKTLLLLVSIFLFTCCTALAQTGFSVRGTLIDSATKQKLVNSSVCVLNAKDSILVAFSRTGSDGQFKLEHLPRGKYQLLVTYPEYADYVEQFKLDSAQTTVNFGNINLTLKEKLLKEVLIKAERAAIKVKGDTTEYNAGSFKVQPNAKVEDLLRQLPGIQVDKDGKITAQGQAVNKVLVDGEEFFGDDPTLVTKNIRADMVDKVQLYDKKSDQATFTGVDDGQKTKTINIQLKDGKKNGYFGKLDVGAGTDGYYQTQDMFNIFKNKQKFSVYGTIANTGKTGLGWEDANKYGSSGGGNVELMDGGGVAIYFEGGGDDLDSFNGQFNGEGIPTARTGGFHYDGKWNKDNQSINLNYKIGSIGIDGNKDILSQNNQPDGIIITDTRQTFNNYLFRQKIDGTYLVKLDTSSNLKVMFDATDKNSKTNSSYITQGTRDNGTLLNENDRKVINNVDGIIYHANAFYTRKFKKKGRTLSLLIDETYNESQAHGNLLSDIRYYNKSGILDSTKTVDQYKTNDLKSSVLKSNLTYSEPLSKFFSVIINYGLGSNISTADRRSFNQSAPNLYNVLDTPYSNNYKFNQISNLEGAIFNYTKKKTIINFGTEVAEVSYKQVNEYTQDVYRRSFINWNPQASYQYKFNQYSSFRISYSGKTVQPTLEQLQPVKINTDPLNISIGNPTLTPSFTNTISASYNAFKVLSDQYLGLYGYYTFTTNPIISNTRTDSAGSVTNQAVNIKNKNSSNFMLNIDFGRKIKALDLSTGFNANITGSTYYNYSNGALNQTESTNYYFGLNFQQYKPKKYNFYFYGGPMYTISKSSLQRINNNGPGANINGSFSVWLPLKFEIASDGDYQYRASTASFNTDFQRFVWNARLSKTFFKGDNLKFSIAGNDLLNQNRGFSRDATGNMLTQTTYTNIKRYFMASVSWDFNHMSGITTKK
jgi:hypothetical protein